MSEIIDVRAREILDSRGNPTVGPANTGLARSCFRADPAP